MRVSLVIQMVKNLRAMWETWVQPLGWENPVLAVCEGMLQSQERRRSAPASVRPRCRGAWAHVTPGAGPAHARPHRAAAAGQRDDQ